MANAVPPCAVWLSSAPCRPSTRLIAAVQKLSTPFDLNGARMSSVRFCLAAIRCAALCEPRSVCYNVWKFSWESKTPRVPVQKHPRFLDVVKFFLNFQRRGQKQVLTQWTGAVCD